MFFDEFAGVQIDIKLPDGKRMAIREAISQLELGDIMWVPPEPPPFGSKPQQFAELMRWQEQLKRSNEATDMLGQKIARALRKGFQERVFAR